MLTSIRSRWLAALAAGALTAVLAAGCSDDKGTNVNQEPPEIPPASTFAIDLSDFSTPTRACSALEGNGGAPASSQANWAWAAGKVLAWSIFATVSLAVPVAAFIEALNHEPTQEADGTWVWAYDFEATQVLHSAELHGKTTEEGIQWSMHISKEGEFSDFVWYTGECNLPGTSGSWTVYASPANPTPLVDIQWHLSSNRTTGDTKYTNVVPDGPENGGYIHHGITGGVPFDAFFDIYNKGQENLACIEWSRTAQNGRVTDPGHYGDQDWHCWDTGHNDISCVD